MTQPTDFQRAPGIEDICKEAVGDPTGGGGYPEKCIEAILKLPETGLRVPRCFHI